VVEQPLYWCSLLLHLAVHHSTSADRQISGTTLLNCVMLRPQRLLPRTGALIDVRDMNTNNDGDVDQEVI